MQVRRKRLLEWREGVDGREILLGGRDSVK